MSTIMAVIPARFGASGSVRTSANPNFALCPALVQTFCPVTDQPPSTRVARVRNAARSEPAPGSLKSWQIVSVPWSTGRTHCSCWPGRPN